MTVTVILLLLPSAEHGTDEIDRTVGLHKQV